MNPERYQQVKRIFLEACEHEGEARESYLAEACADDAELRHEVDKLLAEDEAPIDALNTATTGGVRKLAEAALASEMQAMNGEETLPESIGPYRILRKIGEGGMGIVFEAEQDQPKRRVALKVIRSVFASGTMLRRFEFEVQVLGRLEHPGIARIYEAGTAKDRGVEQPFFAMEFIDGKPITEDALDRKLGTRERLELMARVCDAVHYAHQRGVIHRDLKPPNILVEESHEDSSHGTGLTGSFNVGRPKVLDFGVARATDGDVHLETILTDAGALVGTVPYMSPEQLRGDVADIDVRSDVYALGVILFELLSGKLPLDLQGQSPLEAARTVCETEPMRLGAISPAYRGDIETMVGKALSKEPDRRYQSAAQFGADLRRHLRDEPILARPATTMYQVRKFARRHKIMVTAATLACASFVGGSALAVWQAVEANEARREAVDQRDRAQAAERDATAQRDAAIVLRKEAETQRDRAQAAELDANTQRDAALTAQGDAEAQRDRANAEAQVAEQTADFLVDIFQVADPNRARGETVTALEVLAQGAAKIDEDLADQPLIRARLMNTMGRVYQNLALFEEALPLLEESLALRRAALGDEHSDVTRSLNSYAWALEQSGKFEDAEPLYREALERNRTDFGAQSEEVADLLNNLGHVLNRLGKFEESEQRLREALALRREILDPADSEIAATLSNLGMVLNSRRAFVEAEVVQREALDIRRAAFGDNHPFVAISINNVAVCLYFQQRLDEAQPMFHEALEQRRKIFGDDHPEVAQAINNLAGVMARRGDFEGAEPLYRETMEIDRNSIGADHPDAIRSLFNLATVVDRKGDHSHAAELFTEAIGLYDAAFEEPHWMQGRAESGLGTALRSLGRFEESEAAFLAAYGTFVATRGEDDRESIKCIELIVALYEEWGRPENAASWRVRLPESAPDDADP